MTQQQMQKRGRFSDKASFVTGDLGNQLLKLMPTGTRTDMKAIRNSLVVFNESEWDTLRDRYRYSPDRYQNTFLFSFKGREHPDPISYYVAVGDNAAQFGPQIKLEGEMKYEYRYWGALLISQFLTLFPEGHTHLYMGLAHPTRSVGQRDVMGNNSIGRHFVMLPDGKEVRFTVREAVPWDEPVGGLVRWSETLAPTYNSIDLDSGSQVMVLDIGGGITSFTHVFVDRDNAGKIVFNPVYSDTISPSVDIGVQNVMDRLRGELIKNSKEFAGMKRISNDMLERGIRTGKIKISGEWVDVSRAVALAQTQLMDTIITTYANYMQNGRPYDAIICTGGGMYSLFDTLNSRVLGHKAVFTSVGSDLTNIHFANLQGGDEIFRQWIQREKEQYGAS